MPRPYFSLLVTEPRHLPIPSSESLNRDAPAGRLYNKPPVAESLKSLAKGEKL
jgi:hypothetical protein